MNTQEMLAKLDGIQESLKHLPSKTLKASLPALTQTILDAKDVNSVGEAIRGAWQGYGDGPGGMDDGVYRITIGLDDSGANQINTFKTAMRYLGYGVEEKQNGTTEYKLQKSAFAVATKVVGDIINVVVWDTLSADGGLAPSIVPIPGT
jgi:hypothetical protein